MKALRVGAGAALCVLATGACNTDLTLVLSGLYCSSEEPACLPGYECNRDTDICEPEGTVHARGGSGGTGAAGGSSSGGGGNGAEPGSGGSGEGSSGGSESGSSGSGGAQGGTFGGPDAAVSDAGGDGCVPVTLYQDNDGDQFGRTDVTSFGCPSPGWVVQSGDCRDDLPLVFLGQTTAFEDGYADPDKPGGISFDYDCVSGEQPGANSPAVAAPNCQQLALLGLTCTGSGYEPTTRTGAGIHNLCGSDHIITCQANVLDCNPSSQNVVNAFKCK